MKFLSKVEDVFNITGRGLVIAPGIPYSTKPPVKVGDIVKVHNPSGSIISTKIVGFEMLNRGRPMDSVPFSIDKKVKKENIEVGAKIFFKES